MWRPTSHHLRNEMDLEPDLSPISLATRLSRFCRERTNDFVAIIRALTDDATAHRVLLGLMSNDTCVAGEWSEGRCLRPDHDHRSNPGPSSIDASSSGPNASPDGKSPGSVPGPRSASSLHLDIVERTDGGASEDPAPAGIFMNAVRMPAESPLVFADDLYPWGAMSPSSDAESDGYALRHLFTEPDDGPYNAAAAGQLPGLEVPHANDPIVEEMGADLDGLMVPSPVFPVTDVVAVEVALPLDLPVDGMVPMGEVPEPEVSAGSAAPLMDESPAAAPVAQGSAPGEPAAFVPELYEPMLEEAAGIHVPEFPDNDEVGFHPVAAALAVQRDAVIAPALADRFGFNLGVAGASFAEAFRRLAFCPLCEDLTWPIYMLCDNGHHLCPRCIKQVTFCPYCRDCRPYWRHRSVEDLVATSTHPCRYSQDGCAVMLEAGEWYPHSDSCTFRTPELSDDQMEAINRRACLSRP